MVLSSSQVWGLWPGMGGVACESTFYRWNGNESFMWESWSLSVHLVSRLQKLQLVVVIVPPASVHEALALLRQQSWPRAKHCKGGTQDKMLFPFPPGWGQKFLEDPLAALNLCTKWYTPRSTSYSGSSKQATSSDFGSSRTFFLGQQFVFPHKEVLVLEI